MNEAKTLLDRLKEHHCPRCELSMFCAAGRSGGSSHWCRTCGGYYVPDLDRLVQCSGFPAKLKHYNYDRHTLAHDQSQVSCGWCLTSRLPPEQIVERQDRPPLEGFLIEEDTVRRPR